MKTLITLIAASAAFATAAIAAPVADAQAPLGVVAGDTKTISLNVTGMT